MGLHQTLSEWIKVTKDALDFGPEFPAAMAAQRRLFTEELSRLKYLLEQTQRLAQEKDKLIAQLQATGTARGNLVVDGPACFIRNDNLLDGPFCTSCLDQRHEAVRIVPAPKPQGEDGPATEWVQCARCRTPFRSARLGQFLNPDLPAPVASSASARRTGAAAPARTAKPRTRRKPTTGDSR